MITKVCEVCGKEYKVKNYAAEKSKYCSRACQGIGKRTATIKECSYCGKEIKVIASQVREHNFCNNKCSANYRKENPINPVILICQICGKEYRVKPSHAKNSKYCSNKCHAKSQKGIRPPHTPLHKTIKVQCAHCGNNFYVSPSKVKKNKLFFCNRDCNLKYKESRRDRILCVCETCGKEFYKYQYQYANSNHHFCSRQCGAKYKQKQVICKCDWCGREVNYPKCHSDRHDKHFCNKECFAKYNHNTPLTDEQREVRRQIAFKVLKTYPRETSIEKAIRKWLEINKIVHQTQHIIGKYCVDFYLPDHNIIIEALGDYFHANPIIYGAGKKPLNDMQSKHVQRDKERFTYLRKCGYSVYGFWECDIKRDLEGLMKQITEFNQKRESPLSLFI